VKLIKARPIGLAEKVVRAIPCILAARAGGISQGQGPYYIERASRLREELLAVKGKS
jgi:hypothetical protein